MSGDGVKGSLKSQYEHMKNSYYMTSEEYFDLLQQITDNVFTAGHVNHPGDLWANTEVVGQVVEQTIQFLIDRERRRSRG